MRTCTGGGEFSEPIVDDREQVFFADAETASKLRQV
jgi:hypothetical protein